VIHPWLLHNSELRPSAERFFSPGQVGLLNGWGVFTTIRVAEGVLFAFPRHFARMKRDAELMRVPFPFSPQQMEAQLLRLVERNGERDCTLRAAVVRNKGTMWQGPGIDSDYDLIAFTAPLKDWGESVRLHVVPQARHSRNRFAGTKVLSWAANLIWAEEALLSGFDEALLLNEFDEVSECTSANLFAVFGSDVVTPPLESSGCLPGVTRQVLLEEVRISGLSICERTLTLPDLERADELFITSSTRDLLPVREIEGLQIRFGSNVQNLLQSAFEEHRRQYITCTTRGY